MELKLKALRMASPHKRALTRLLKELQHLSLHHLAEVSRYVKRLQPQAKANNRLAILALAGSWASFSEDDFQDFRRVARESGEGLFNREVEL